jgi:hypothetical protein
MLNAYQTVSQQLNRLLRSERNTLLRLQRNTL